MKKISGVLLIAVLVFSLFSCGGHNVEKVVIAQQFGLGYAQLVVMKEMHLIEKYYPNAQIEWAQLGFGGAIREAMAAGQVGCGKYGRNTLSDRLGKRL